MREYRSSHLLSTFMEDAWFTVVERRVGNIKTAFSATYSEGEGPEVSFNAVIHFSILTIIRCTTRNRARLRPQPRCDLLSWARACNKSLSRGGASPGKSRDILRNSGIARSLDFSKSRLRRRGRKNRPDKCTALQAS